MKKYFVLYLLFLSMPSLAVVSDFANMCGDYAYTNMVASFSLIQYICNTGEYLPADTLGCTVCPYGYTCVGGTYPFNEHYNQGITISTYTCDSGYYLPANALGCSACPSGATCAGGTYTFNATSAQGVTYNAPFTQNQNDLCSPYYIYARADFSPIQYTCNAGYYLPANAIACVQCPANSYCGGGTFVFNETTDQGIVACSSGTFSPTGSAVCYPHILHVGDSNVYLKSTKQTTPSLNFRIGNDIFYANMTTVRTKMNKDSEHYFHAQWENNHYYVCDDTTCPDAE